MAQKFYNLFIRRYEWERQCCQKKKKYYEKSNNVSQIKLKPENIQPSTLITFEVSNSSDIRNGHQ